MGVLVQTNFGGYLHIAGVPVGEILKEKNQSEKSLDGSCMIVVATDAPLDARQLKRLAKRAMLGFGRAGGISSHGSGDYVIAFSTAKGMRMPHESGDAFSRDEYLRDDRMTPLFTAVIEATEEAILNSLFMARTVTGYQNRVAQALPVEKVLTILQNYHPLRKQ